MELTDVIKSRRALRALKPVKIDDSMVNGLAGAAQLAPSCFNKQPWNYIFARDKAVLELLFGTLPDGNRWARSASMIVGVFSKKEDDCILGDRIYHLFDVGVSTGFMMLKATDMGLIMHPIAGYDMEKASDVLGIPHDFQLITLLIVGARTDVIPEFFAEHQITAEKERPPRKDLSEFTHLDRFRS